jgi:HK97 gp10 family phage protein
MGEHAIALLEKQRRAASRRGDLTFNVLGLKQLHRELKDLQDEALALGLLLKAARRAFHPVLVDAQRLAPKDTRLLASSLQVRAMMRDGEVVVGLRVAPHADGTSKAIARAAKLARIAGADAKGMGRARRGAIRESAHWRWHFVELGTSKMRAKPFLRPALEKNASGILRQLALELQKSIARTLRKRAKAAIPRAA